VDNVRPQTRARVLKTIDEVRYVPSPLARGLSAYRTHCTGMVTTDVSDHSFAEAVAGAENEARRRGIGGLILARAHGASEELLAASAAGIPIVAIGPADWLAVQSRIAGYRAAHEEWGAGPAADVIEHALDWSPTSRQAATARLLARRVPFSALFAHSDLLALGAIRELCTHGLDVPGDVSVVGYDDIDVAAFFDPPLTTVRQPMETVGALAASLVIGDVTERTRRRKRAHLVPATVIARESVAPLVLSAR
jgi:DNA-binding LacI/PurR family transcriptional regulator